MSFDVSGPCATHLFEVDSTNLKKTGTIQSTQEGAAVVGTTVGRLLTNNGNLVKSRCSTPTVQGKGKKFMGIQLAPFNVPWHRRMETLSLCSAVMIFFFGGIVGTLLMVYMALCTRYYLLSFLYLVWFFYDMETPERGGRRIEWIRKWNWWTRVANYFPVQLVKTVELDPSKNYLFAYHPHGIFCCGAISSFVTDGAGFSKKFPGLTPHVLVLDIQFKFLLSREYFMSFGFCSPSRSSMNFLLSRPEGGHVAVIIPGGASESLDAHPGQECVLHLKKRKGFIKVALTNGSPLVPVFCFGENNVFNQLSNKEGTRVRRIQNYLQKMLSFAPVFILGRGIFQYSFGLLPQRRPITVVVGGAIPVEKREQPSQKEVDDLHEKYVQCLINLFETHKAEYGMEDGRLKIV